MIPPTTPVSGQSDNRRAAFSDGATAPVGLPDIPYMRWQAWIQDIESAIDQRDSVCSENNRLRTEKAALLVQLDIVADHSDTILWALELLRVAMQERLTIGNIKEIEQTADIIRAVKANYGKDRQ